MKTKPDYKIEKIVLAFDSSGCSHITIEHIFSIASHLKSTIQAIYIEDNNLLNAAGLPFSREISLHTAQTRKLDSEQITRHFQNLASQIRKMLETQSRLANIESSFRITRGNTRLQTILQEALNAQLILLPAAHRIRQVSKQKYIAVLMDQTNDPTPISLAAFLAGKFGANVLAISETTIELTEDVRELFRSKHPDIRFYRYNSSETATWISQLKSFAIELLIVPESHPLLEQQNQIQKISNQLKCDIMLIRHGNTHELKTSKDSI